MTTNLLCSSLQLLHKNAHKTYKHTYLTCIPQMYHTTNVQSHKQTNIPVTHTHTQTYLCRVPCPSEKWFSSNPLSSTAGEPVTLQRGHWGGGGGGGGEGGRGQRRYKDGEREGGEKDMMDGEGRGPEGVRGKGYNYEWESGTNLVLPDTV